MDSARWNQIIETAADQAIDEAGDSDPRKLALRAATLAAEWVTEALAEEDGLAAEVEDL